MIIFVYVDAPTKPLNLTAKATDTSATLSWQPPVSNGGREDLFYKVKYMSSEEQQLTYYSPISGTSFTLTSLTPLTMYTFMVVAENEVSQEFPDQFPESHRTSSGTFVTTQEGGECI